MSSDFQIVSFVACDEIRYERTNKLLMIGVYGSDIVLEHVPETLGLSFLLCAKGAHAGPLNVEIQFLFAGTRVGQIKINGAVREHSESNILTFPIDQRLTFSFDSEGLLEMQYRTSEGAGWATVGTMTIRLPERASFA